MLDKKTIDIAELMGVSVEEAKEKLGFIGFDTWASDVEMAKHDLKKRLAEVDDVTPKWSELNQHQRNAISQHGCCKAARLGSSCVCMYHFTCPIHGGTHVGTHD